jgi:hypothetical protein
MENLNIYNKLRTPEAKALKTITGGRISGMTDIKPQWRVMVMTDTFGVCGVGWKYDNVQFTHQIGANNEICTRCTLDLYVKINGEWSAPIHGVGGNRFSSNEKHGLYVSDEADKMAMTDALSVAMKMIGVGADVYMGYSDSKYYNKSETNNLQDNEDLSDWSQAISQCNNLDEMNRLYRSNESAITPSILELFSRFKKEKGWK